MGLIKWILLWGICWSLAFVGYISIDTVLPAEEYEEKIIGVPIITTTVENGTTYAQFHRDGTYYHKGYTRPYGGNMLMMIPSALVFLPFIILVVQWRANKLDDDEDANMAKS